MHRHTHTLTLSGHSYVGPGSLTPCRYMCQPFGMGRNQPRFQRAKLPLPTQRKRGGADEEKCGTRYFHAQRAPR